MQTDILIYRVWKKYSKIIILYVISFLLVENMWTNKEFIEKFLEPNNQADKWDSFIYPAMKDSIICSMLVAQDTIEPRKVMYIYL